MGIATISTC